MAMMPVNRMVDQTPVTAAGLDPESAWWLGVLAGTGPRREAALARLHELLVRVARAEVARRGPRVRITGPELDDLACQAAADALMAITGKLGQFRGESRFTTWACKFAIFEVSAKISRHFWRHPAVPLDALVLELGSNRNAIYKVLFDARRKLRSVLVANGYLRDDSPRNS